MSTKGKCEMEAGEAEKLLAEEDSGCLCLSSGGEPYGVPVSYAYVDGRILFHCALKGKKLDYIRDNPRVCFTVSRHPDRARPHHAEKGCDYRYESVICRGKARIVEELPERRALLNKFLAHFNVRLGKKADDNLIPEEAAARLACVAITIDSMTGRKKVEKK
ncbi:MAG: pyridoxamine 5'-phosphate oxidase family protein [Elusimicrobia bacterium]|nr:pyridoxamine 5'-phosphate oxidase family protein [Elusimicrobiota bacterium]